MSGGQGFAHSLGRARASTWLLATACLWALLLWLAAALGMGTRIEAVAAQAPGALPAPAAAVRERIGPLGQYAEAASHPLFTQDRRPRAFLAVAQSEGEGRGATLDFVLTGVLISPQVRLAILQPSAGGDSQRVREGAAPEGAADWRLLEVRPRAALFEGPGGQVALELRSFGVAGSPEPRAGAPVPSMVPRPPQEGVRDAGDSAPDEARRIEDIRRRIEARRAQMRQQNQDAGDGGGRLRPLSGPAR
jgi:general secretion pathway protein N